MKTLNDYEVNDVLLITETHKHGKETRAAVVSCINYKGNGLVTIMGYYGLYDEYLPTGQGAFDPKEIGTKKFGFYSEVKKIGSCGHFGHLLK